MKHKRLPAFSLAEGIVYVALLALLAGTLTGVIVLVFRYKAGIEDRTKVNENLSTLIKSIRDDMYNGTAIEITLAGDLVIQTSEGEIAYSLNGNQVFRQLDDELPLAMTSNTNNVTDFTITDISSAEAAGTIQIQLAIENYPSGSLKPPVSESVTSTISLKFI